MVTSRTIHFNEINYTVPVVDDLTILTYVYEQKYLRAVSLILGDAQWKQFKESNRDRRGRVTTKVFQEFAQEALGSLNLLGTLLRECPDELEADLLSEYHLDIEDMWEGRLSVAKVARLTEQLPAGSRVWKSLGWDNAWTSQEHLTALLADLLNWANYQRGEGKGHKPQPVARPQELKDKAAKAARDEALAVEAARRYKKKQQS